MKKNQIKFNIIKISKFLFFSAIFIGVLGYSIYTSFFYSKAEEDKDKPVYLKSVAYSKKHNLSNISYVVQLHKLVPPFVDQLNYDKLALEIYTPECYERSQKGYGTKIMWELSGSREIVGFVFEGDFRKDDFEEREWKLWQSYPIYDTKGNISMYKEEILATGKVNTPTCSNVTDGCKADINDDGRIDIYDLTYVNSRYGSDLTTCTNNCSAADMNNDNKINILDLSYVASRYGQKCESSY